MGFTTGLVCTFFTYIVIVYRSSVESQYTNTLQLQTGGVTLTLGLAYLTVYTHQRNRASQSTSLRSQSRILQSLTNPPPPLPSPSSPQAYRYASEQTSVVDSFKDSWNTEIESAVRWIQRTDFNELRNNLEGSVARLWTNGLVKGREGIEIVEDAAGPRVREVIDVTKTKAGEYKDKAAVGVDRAAASAISGIERAGAGVVEGGSKIAALAKEKASNAKQESKDAAQKAEQKAAALKDAAEAKTARAGAETRSSVQDAKRSSAGTVDAARGAVRDVISKGIQKGKEVVGKAQEAVGLATERVERRVKAEVSPVSSQEAALARRYAPVQIDTRTPEQVLADRYRPIDANPTREPVQPVL